MTGKTGISSSLSRSEVEVVEAVAGEAAKGLKYDGVVEGVEGAEADVNAEVGVEESSGDGEEMEIAEAIDCDTSEMRREARF